MPRWWHPRTLAAPHTHRARPTRHRRKQLNNNKKLKLGIEDLRREKMQRESIKKKLEREVANSKREMLAAIQESQQATTARDKAERLAAELEQTIATEMAEFDAAFQQRMTVRGAWHTNRESATPRHVDADVPPVHPPPADTRSRAAAARAPSAPASGPKRNACAGRVGPAWTAVQGRDDDCPRARAQASLHQGVHPRAMRHAPRATLT